MFSDIGGGGTDGGGDVSRSLGDIFAPGRRVLHAFLHAGGDLRGRLRLRIFLCVVFSARRQKSLRLFARPVDPFAQPVGTVNDRRTNLYYDDLMSDSVVIVRDLRQKR